MKHDARLTRLEQGGPRKVPGRYSDVDLLAILGLTESEATEEVLEQIARKGSQA